MSFRIVSQVVPVTASRYLSQAQDQINRSLTALTTGSRITRASDDAAGFAIAESLRGQLGGTNQARHNTQAAMGLVQTAEGGLNEQSNILIRLRELAVYAASDTVGDQERKFLNGEFTQLIQEFDRIAKSTRFGHKRLLTGTGEQFEFQVGAFQGPENVIKFKLEADTTASDVDIDGLEISDQDDAVDALASLDSAMNRVAGTRASFGAMQSRMNHAINVLAAQAENLDAARGHIADADIADEVTKLSRAQILQEAGSSVLAQANASATRALRLLNV